MTNILRLFRGNVLLRELCLSTEAVEIGSSSHCDLVVEDPDLPRRAFLVQPRGGSVWSFDLTREKLEPKVLPFDSPMAIGAQHHLVRVNERVARPGGKQERSTLSLGDGEPVCSFMVLVGRGAEARRLVVSDKPVRIGSARSNDLVLLDPAVSGQHCRLEPDGQKLIVRDLESTNGTFLQGVRISRAQVSAGSQLRIGRTDLRVVASMREGKPSSARPLIAVSSAMQEAVAEAQDFARLPWPILILGPSGAGKEELSGVLHRESGRSGPFVALNAGGLPRELIESELFGHEKGAFTGAASMRRGAFEQAEGGTLLLDEIGELPLDMQTRLLRVLETWQIRRVGAEQGIAVNVRLVCATHRDLSQMVQAGTFRQDLYYRLARLVLHLPALSERRDDILPLANHFLRSAEGELGERRLSREAEARLLAHAWPGNARELRNVVCSAAAMTPAPELSAHDIERALKRVSGAALVAPAAIDVQAIESAVQRYGGNLSAVSRALDIPRSTLRDRIRRGS